MTREYSPVGFRQALEARLRNEAEQTGRDLARIRQLTRKKSKRGAPVEAFGVNPTQWIPMNQHQIQRKEHAVAALLPDGSVWVAGGKDLHQAYHSLEIFRPPYLQQGRVPDLLSIEGAPTWTLGDPTPKTLNVRCYDVASPVRVALIKLASVTHGFDMGQRYVEVSQPLPPQQQPDGTWNVFVTVPATGLVAPPGYYWMTIRDSVGRPSPGRLLRLKL